MYQTITPEEIHAGREALMGGNVGGKLNLIVKDVDEGCTVYDMDGKAYLDCTSQAWSMGTGMKHKKVIKAVQEQVELYSHIRTTFDTIPKLLLAQRLSAMAPGRLKKVNFCLHGGNAIEGALKVAMRQKYGTKFVSFYDGYHGRSLANMNLCWPHPDNVFLGWMNNTVRVPQAYCYRCPYGREYGSCGLQCANFIDQAMTKAVDGAPLGLIMEPIQGNGGMIDYPVEFHKAIREICTRHDMVLIWDEIQTGFGRTGYYFTSEYVGVVPDVLVFGKALGGGHPIAGMLVDERLKPLGAGDHSFTFAHYPVAMAASLATLEIMEEENICEQYQEKGAYVTKHLKAMQEKYEIMGDIRGPGLMIGIELVKNRKTKEPFQKAEAYMVTEGLKRGLMLGGAKYSELGNVIKIKPPAVTTYPELDRILELFESLIIDCERMKDQ